MNSSIHQQVAYDSLPTNLVQKLAAHSSCTTLAYNGQGDTLATGGEDKLVKLWNTKERKTTAILHSKYVISALAFSLDNELFMSCTNDHKATMYTTRGSIK